MVVRYEHRVGSLQLVTQGAAASVGADTIRVTGPLGYVRDLAALTTLSLLNTGKYTVTAQPKVIGGVTHQPIPPSQEVEVTPSSTTEVLIRYVPVTATATRNQNHGSRSRCANNWVGSKARRGRTTDVVLV